MKPRLVFAAAVATFACAASCTPAPPVAAPGWPTCTFPDGSTSLQGGNECASQPPFETEAMGPDIGTPEHDALCATHPESTFGCPTGSRVK